MTEPVLANGCYRLPTGTLATVVTCLEWTAQPPPRASFADDGLRLERFDQRDSEAYLALFALIGQDWMWYSRLLMARAKLEAILADPKVEVYALKDGAASIGIVELDFREAGVCELAFFGLAPGAIGKGAGRFLMEQAIGMAWSRPIARLWVHTCTFDHPLALAFYRRSGFRPFALMVEVHDDPRLLGLLPREASPQVPLIDA